MRPIEYRVWDKTLKQMFPVSELLWGKEGKIISIVVKMDKSEYRSIDDLVLLEYTGNKDKHGKKIFEGDILRWSSDQSESAVRWSFEYEDNHPGFRLKDRYGQYGECEVVDNLYQRHSL